MMNHLFVLFLLATAVTAQSGGQIAVTESAIANGGGNSSAGQFATSVTAGQTVAGGNVSGGQYAVQAGFWKPAFPPSAALASISGRISTDGGTGIKNVILSIRDASNGVVMTTITGPFGYYSFDGLEVGQTYIISLTAKRFTFASSPMLITLDAEISGLDWVADH